jgi:hypothetical protein
MSNLEALAHMTPDHVALATAALERLGWDVLSCELDLVRETFRLELGREALRIVLDARNGRVVFEREIVRQRAAGNVRHTHGQIWDRELLGRRRPEGVRHGLLMVANYIQDNGAARLEARAAVALLLK